MATPIRMPALAQTSDELRLTAWLKTEGEQVLTAAGIAAVPQLDLALTVDHRTVDGATAARFLTAVCAELER